MKEFKDIKSISALDHTFKVSKILYAFYNDNTERYEDIEFEDENGDYHHWKLEFDSGKVNYK